MPRDDAVDELYQRPLNEFTAARDALAKSAGADGGGIKKLQKPALAAWAVNQVYWQRRKIFDRLTYTAERLRAAHARRLAGKDADVGEAERTHDAAVAAAAGEARALLEKSGDRPSAATLTAVTETFRAYPWAEPPGRLTRPQRPGGFEALAGLLPKGAAQKPLATIVGLEEARRARARERPAREDADRTARERAREIASVQSTLSDARQDARKAEAAVERRRRAIEHAERDRQRLETQLERAVAELQTLKHALAGEVKQAAAAASEVKRLEERLQALSAEKR